MSEKEGGVGGGRGEGTGKGTGTGKRNWEKGVNCHNDPDLGSGNQQI